MATKLLLQFDESFHDGSGNDHATITEGYFSFLTDSSFGTGLRANTGRLKLDDHSDWQFGTGEFTVDFWVKINSSGSSYQYPFELGTSRRLSVQFNYSNRYARLYVNGSYQTTAYGVFDNDVWFHVAVIRSGGVCRMFISGTQVLEWSNAASILPTGGMAVCNSLSGSEPPSGVAEFRLCDHAETAWWNGFTPPSSQYSGTPAPEIPDDTSGDFLLPFDDNYYAFDRADNAVEPQFNGHYGFENGSSGKAIRFNYGNLFFDNHDGLKLGTDNFTLDFRIKVDDFSTGTVYLFNTTGSSSNYLRMLLYSDGQIRTYIGGGYFYAYNAIVVGQWHHVALVRTGVLVILYVDGVMKATYWSSSVDVNPDGKLYVGASENSESVHLVGLLEDVRFTKATARWVTDFDASQVTITYPSLPKPSRDQPADFLVHFNDSFADISETLPVKSGCFDFETGVFDKAARFKYGNVKYENLDSLKLGGDDFTLDFRVRVDSYDNGNFYLIDSAGSSSYYLKFYLYSDGMIRMYLAGSYFYSPTGIMQTGQWHHIALVRVNRVFLLYVDGVTTWMTAYAPSNINNDGNLYLGSAENSESVHLDGLLDEFRIVKGTAIWIEDFTPPSAEYLPTQPTVTEPQATPDFVCHFDGGIFDSSGNNTTVTETGEVEYVAGKFDEAGKYDSAQYAIIGQPSDWQIGTSDCSLDCWIRLPANYTTGRYLFDLGGQRLSAYTYSSNQLRLYVAGSYYYLTDIPTEQWFHLAICRVGRCLFVYINGQLKLTTTNTNSIAPTYDFSIGSYYSGSSQFIGQIDELRLFKSDGVFDHEFTPPTSPQTDPPITAPPTNTPRLIGPSGEAFANNQTFRWTAVFQADRFEFELIGVETISDYPNRTLNKTLALGSYQWRVRAGNSYGYGPWSDAVPLIINQLILSNPLCGHTHDWPEYLYVRDGLDVITLKYAATGVGDSGEEGWQNAAGTYKLAWDSYYSLWRLSTPNVTIQTDYSNAAWSLNTTDPSDGFQIEYDDYQPWFFYFAPDVQTAFNPPVTKDGFCYLRAFDWDFEQSEDGQTITGHTANDATGNRRDYWKLKLRAGQEYTFTFDMLDDLYRMYFRLYDRDGKTNLASTYTYYSGIASFTYTPSVTGEYFLVADSYSYGYYGHYSMQSDPAPLRGVFSISPCGFTSRELFTASHTDLYKALRYQIESNRPDCIDACSRFFTINRDRFTARHETIAKARRDFCVRHLTGEIFPNAHSIRHLQDQLNPDSNNAYTQTGWRIIARNTATEQTEELGFIPAVTPEKKLENIPLADGVYEIEARPSDLFWQDCHCRKLLTLKVGDGGTEVTGLPVIQNLRREISPLNFQPVLKWNIAAEYAPADMRFAIWFSETTPVDTSGEPDITINYFDGQGEYQTAYTQTEECYVAVAAITDTEVGQIAEIHLPWTIIPPISPPNQTAK